VQLAPAVIGTRQVVVVAAVEPGGPAAAAGIQPRDLVQRVAGRNVETIEDVYDALRSHNPGDRVRVVVRRSTQDRELEVTLGRLPSPENSNGG
jgi:S1-C subfamily serine protease